MKNVDIWISVHDVLLYKTHQAHPQANDWKAK